MKLFSKNFQKRIVDRKIFRSRKFMWSAILFACIGFVLLCLSAFHIKQLTQHTIEKERAKLANKTEIFFEKIPHQPHFNQFVSFIQNTKNVRTIEKFQDSYFAATDAGLLKMTQDGKLLKHFTVLDGLPESDLTTLAVFNSQLFIGTRESGLVVFDGEIFSSYHFKNHETQTITDLLSDNQRLLIGTFAGGLLEFDGKKFFEITNNSNKRIVGVSFINSADSTLFVGTFAEGLWIFENGIWKQFTKENGLLSNRVVGTKIVGENLFVGTDLGVSQAVFGDLDINSQKIFQQNVDLPTLSSLEEFGDQVFLTTDDGIIFAFNGKSNRLTRNSLNEINWKKPENITNSRLFFYDEKIWFVGTGGIWQTSAETSARFLPSPFGDFSDQTMPTGNVVSALAIDRNSRLWVGNFRRGIDIFSKEGIKLAHLETDVIKEINALNAQENAVVGATSKGAVSFDQSFKSDFLINNDSLPSSSITHISLENSGKNSNTVFATSKGVWLDENGVSRGFSNVNGLPSNTISTTLFARNSAFVGTLGGLAQIEKGKVVRVYKDSNSILQNNWITGLSSNGSRVFAGTYGGGVYEILPSGELRGFTNETGKIFVNPNAMFSNAKKLFIGTLSGAWVFDLESEKWTHLTKVLPSINVLSIAGDSENTYFGTTNGIAKINNSFF